jgi:serine/threonine protein kinase
LPWPARGQTVGDLTILRQLGQGSFARVYLAREASAGGRTVVVKFTCASDKEAHALGRLDHDHIVPILWARPYPGTGLHIVCMPFLGGATLDDVLHHVYRRPGTPPPLRNAAVLEAIGRTVRPGDPPPARRSPPGPFERLSFVDGVVRLGEQLTDALVFLQEQGLVHCDLKPSNVLLTPEGRPLLLDFNLVQAAGAKATGAGGTFVYMPPEQIRAWLDRGALTFEESSRADLYSLGVLLYELLTGRLPLGAPPAGLSGAALARWVLERQRDGCPPVRDCNPDVSRRLAQFLDRCLSLDPGNRPAGAAEAAAELRRCRRRRVSLTPAVALLAVLAVLPLGLAHLQPQAEPPVDHRAVAALHRRAAQKHLVEGWKHLRAGEPARAPPLLEAATKSYDQAIEQTREWQDYAGRGRAFMLLGKFSPAANDFEEAEKTLRRRDQLANVAGGVAAAAWGPGRLGVASLLLPRQDPRRARALACLSYCHLRRPDHTNAYIYGRQALEAGERSAAFLNNLGYLCLRRGSPADLERADRYFKEALDREPDLVPAFRNQIELVLKRHQIELAMKRSAEVPAWALDQIDRMILLAGKRGQETADMHKDAARLYARAALDSRREAARPEKSAARANQHLREQRARGYVQSACFLGAEPKRLGEDPFLKKVLGKDFFTSPNLSQVRPPQSTLSVDACLVDPLSSPLP